MVSSEGVNSYPLVSVIIPTYKRPDFLKRAIASVKAQSYPNIEIIVVDDANDKNTHDLISQFVDVKLLVNDTNKGGGYSRNRGMRESKGDFVNFLDDDDILYPTKIEQQVNVFLKNSNSIDQLGMVTCHTNDGRTGRVIKKENKLRGDIYKKILSKFLIDGIETVLYKKEALKKVAGFDEQLLANQEYDLQIRICEHYKIEYVDAFLTEEFQSTDQISINFRKKFKAARQLFNKHRERFRKQGKVFYFKMWLKYKLLDMKFLLAMLLGQKIYNKFLR